jgi:hypothetical protein
MSGQWHGGKGSRARPLSVDSKTFDNNWDNIFKKKVNDMTPSVKEMKQGTCGCGRSPTGDCIGWHGLTEDAYQVKLEEYMTNREDKDGKSV